MVAKVQKSGKNGHWQLKAVINGQVIIFKNHAHGAQFNFLRYYSQVLLLDNHVPVYVKFPKRDRMLQRLHHNFTTAMAIKTTEKLWSKTDAKSMLG